MNKKEDLIMMNISLKEKAQKQITYARLYSQVHL